MRGRFTASCVFLTATFAVSAWTPAISQSSAADQSSSRTTIPRAADGKPDFTGVWAGPGFSHKVGPNDTEPNIIFKYDPAVMAPFQPGGEALIHPKPTGDLATDDALALCMPVGIPRSITGPFAQQWMQTPGLIVVLYEWFHTFRLIPTDGRPHPKDVDLTWFGDSVGRWEGDTLVIDTIGLKAWTIDETINEFPDGGIAGRWHSDALRVIERIRYTSPTTASYEITIDDPKIFTRPWTVQSSMTLHSKWTLLEMICEENNRCRAGNCKESDAQKALR